MKELSSFSCWFYNLLQVFTILIGKLPEQTFFNYHSVTWYWIPTPMNSVSLFCFAPEPCLTTACSEYILCLWTPEESKHFYSYPAPTSMLMQFLHSWEKPMRTGSIAWIWSTTCYFCTFISNNFSLTISTILCLVTAFALLLGLFLAEVGHYLLTFYKQNGSFTIESLRKILRWSYHNFRYYTRATETAIIII